VSEIGTRLRKERERLKLSQRTFGQVGGVAANAQGHYESGERSPKADYLAAIAVIGVDILFVLTGQPTSCPGDNLSLAEGEMLIGLRSLQKEDQDAIGRLTTSLAQLWASRPASAKPTATWIRFPDEYENPNDKTINVSRQ